MPDEDRKRKLSEVQRIMRKQLAAWCNPTELNGEEIAAINEIIASSAAARFDSVAAVLNKTDLGKALRGQTLTGETTEHIFAASVVQGCHVKGIKLKKSHWPESLEGRTIPPLSEEVLS